MPEGRLSLKPGGWAINAEMDSGVYLKAPQLPEAYLLRCGRWLPV